LAPALWRDTIIQDHPEIAARMCDVPVSSLWYDLVILRYMKTAISLPDETFRRVDRAAKRLGLSRSELFARAAENWLDGLEDDGVTEAIDRAIAGLPADHEFTDVAAATLAARDQS
jgi:predicted DNA-binding protein